MTTLPAPREVAPIFDGVDALTFDCYGTLIDWERGLLMALRPILDAHGVREPDDTLLERFASMESGAEAGPWKPYRQVLEDVLQRIGDGLGFNPTPGQVQAFGGSPADWPAFPDSADALGRLAERFELCIVSNIDDDLFARSALRLRSPPFAHVVTAEQVRAYKPAPNHFREVLRRLDRPAARVVHAAQSPYHDLAPARSLGWTTVWVNRRAGQRGGGATPHASVRADLEVRSLAELADLAGV